MKKIQSQLGFFKGKKKLLNFWAGLYGYDMDLMMGDTKSAAEETTVVQPDLILASGLDEAVLKARKGLRTLSFVPLPQTKERLILNPTVASKHSGFGQGFLLTTMASNDLTYANVVDGAPGVVQTIFLSVLNGSKYLDEVSYLDSAQRSVYFFAKRTGTSSDIAEALMASDVDNVNRLAGQFSVDIKSLQRGKDLIISNQEMELHVLYRYASQFEFSRLFQNNNKNFPPFSNLAEMLNFLFFVTVIVLVSWLLWKQ